MNPKMSSAAVAELAASALRPYLLAQSQTRAGIDDGHPVSSSANAYRAEKVLYVLRQHLVRDTAAKALEAVVGSPEDDAAWQRFRTMLAREIERSPDLTDRLQAFLTPSEPNTSDEFDSFFGGSRSWERFSDRARSRGKLLGAGDEFQSSGPPSGDGWGGLLGAVARPGADEFVGADEPTESVPKKKKAPPRSKKRSPAPKSRAKGTAVSAWLNAELEDFDARHPLFVGETYALAFGLDREARNTAVASGAPVTTVFAERTTEIVLTVQLDGDDFDVAERSRPLRFKRTGTSVGKARFDITPLRNGPTELVATVHENGNFLQQLTLTFDVGVVTESAIEATSVGRPLSSAEVLHPRDIGFAIEAAPAGGFMCTAWGATAARVHLPIQAAELASAIEQVRKALMKVVGKRIFQTNLDIPDDERDAAVAILAKAGFRLYQQIFYHSAGGADAKRLGDWLREQTTNTDEVLQIQLLSRDFPVPWSLLYIAERWDPDAIDWRRFLGMSHIIEQIPLQNTLSTPDGVIDSQSAGLSVSVNFNQSIDEQMRADFVARQVTYWDAANDYTPSVKLTSRFSRTELIDALNSGNTTDQILYLYCHAVAVGLTAGGPDSSSLVLSGDEAVTLEDLNLEAPTQVQLPGSPLIFINACESAELSPLFYDGFVPYFMAKGARGVIGTECKTPALFAAEWASEFFDSFLNGAELGQVFLRMRRDYYEKHGNPLGLLYGVHCDSDTRVAPGMVRG